MGSYNFFKGGKGIPRAGVDSLAVLPFLLEALLETGVGCLRVRGKGRGQGFKAGAPARDFVREPVVKVARSAKVATKEGDSSGDPEVEVVTAFKSVGPEHLVGVN